MLQNEGKKTNGHTVKSGDGRGNWRIWKTAGGIALEYTDDSPDQINKFAAQKRYASKGWGPENKYHSANTDKGWKSRSKSYHAKGDLAKRTQTGGSSLGSEGE